MKSSAWGVSPLLALVVAAAILYARGPLQSHESATLLLATNFLLTTLVSGFIAAVAGRTYLVNARTQLLAICVGMSVWGLSAFVATAGGHVGNYNITVHNLGVAAAGLCHLAGAFAARRRDERIDSPGAALALGIAAASTLVGIIWMATLEHWLPVFFVDGTGSTPIRTVVLSLAVASYAVAALLTIARYRATRWRFLYWYGLGLAAIACGSVGLMMQSTHGSWLGWIARSMQYLGGLYMLAGTIASSRESASRGFSLEERLLRTQRTLRNQSELIRAINDNTTELIFMKDLSGRLTYANAATLRLLGIRQLDADRPDREYFSVPGQHASVTDNDRRVMTHGEIIQVEEIYTGADGRERIFQSTKSPLRDDSGEIMGVIGVSRDITEQKRSEQALLAADRRKDEFLATLAHELRNPLAPIRNGLAVLARSFGDRQTFDRLAPMMERQIGHTVRLVDDLLDVSRISSGKIALKAARVRLDAVVQQAMDIAAPLVRAAGHELAVRVPPGPIVLNADGVRLAQVIGNLLHNACKFTPRGGRIALEVTTHERDLLIEVSDNGVGIPARELGNIFNLFSQLDNGMERSQGGLGIGLTLVKRLVELHGGSVGAHSDGPGRGSRFVVRLPGIIDAPAPAALAAAPARTAGSSRVLVVDDNRDSAASLAALLSLNGNETHVAHGGEEALAESRNLRPEVIVLDLGMPHPDGFDVCRQIRAEPWGRDVTIVAVTGLGREEDRQKSAEAGFDGHFVKPVDPDVLLALVGRRARD
jgi:PAS domain S-box-containing protein